TGTSNALQKSIASLGANNILVMPGTAATGGISQGSGTTQTLTPDDCELLAACPDIRAVAPIVRGPNRAQVIYQNKNYPPVSIIGTTQAYLDVRDWTNLADGEVFTDRDVRNGNKVCLIGQTIVKNLFDGGPAVGKEIRIQNVAFTVVGVLASKGA